MRSPLVLASRSATRIRLLRAAGIAFEPVAARVDEPAMRDALALEGAGPRDMADALAEMKALRVAEKRPDALVIGSDQVLDLDGEALGKVAGPEGVAGRLRQLSGRRHALLSAAVIVEGGRPVWRHVGVARLTMRAVSEAYLADYVARNAAALGESLGGYHVEKEGVRLFSRIEGDTFTIQGLPLVELLSYLALRGAVAA